MDISVVIPTCNRKARLLGLLQQLGTSSFPPKEVIVVDSGNDVLTEEEWRLFNPLQLRYVRTEKSVCIQRNTGIALTASPWIFLCDDDIEVPPDYLAKLVAHLQNHPGTGAVSGLVLQEEAGGWTAQYPLQSAVQLAGSYIFQWGIWGEIQPASFSWPLKKISLYYRRKGNHMSKAGWPVLTDFSGDYFHTPLYALGASLVRKDWLLQNRFDEVLDRHGIGDNYGIALGFPGGIDVLNHACVKHHREQSNRLQGRLQYFRRTLALDYFIQTKTINVQKRWLLWSLLGKLLFFLLFRDFKMVWPALRATWLIAVNRNPYIRAAREGKKVTEPTFSIRWKQQYTQQSL